MKLPDPQRSRVILIGASAFSDELLPDQPSVRDTVAELARILGDPELGIVEPAHCRVMLDEPSVPRIAEALTAATREATDLLLIYFTGHAMVDAGRGELYLASTEARRHDPEQGALKYDFLRQAVQDSPAATKVVILDCDYSSTALNSGTALNEPAGPVLSRIDGAHVLTGDLLGPLQTDRPFVTLAEIYPGTDLPLVIRRPRKAEPSAVPRRLLLIGAAAIAGVAAWEILHSDDAPSSSPIPPADSLKSAPAETFSSPAPTSPAPTRLTLEHSHQVTSIATTRDGTRIVTSTYDGKLYVWDAKTGDRIRMLTDRKAFTTGVGLHPNGRLAVAVGEVPDHSGHLWDLSTGKRRPSTIVGAFCATFNHDGSLLFTGSGYEWGRLWSGNTFRQIGGSLKNGDPVSDAAFSPDGKTLAVASWDGQVRLWDLEGRLRSSFRTAQTMVYSVAFSPDGKLLAVGQNEGIVQIFDAQTGKQVKRLTIHSDEPDNVVETVEFSPDGKILLTAAGNGPVTLLRTSDFQDVKKRIDAGAPSTFSLDGTAVMLTYYSTVEVVPLDSLA